MNECEQFNPDLMYDVLCFFCQRAEVDVEVMSPLNRLLLMFQGPMKVIKKRHDKELDFNKISSRVGNPRDSEQLKSVSLVSSTSTLFSSPVNRILAC